MWSHRADLENWQDDFSGDFEETETSSEEFKMETVEDMNKILKILDNVVGEKKVPFDAIPKRSSEEYRLLGEKPEEFLALIAREKKVVDEYFNALQMQEWAQNHKRWIETGLDGYTVRELSPVGKRILKDYLVAL